MNLKAIDLHGLFAQAKRLHRANLDQPIPDIFMKLVAARCDYLASIGTLMVREI